MTRREFLQTLLAGIVFYGGFYFVWSMLCYVYPEIP